MSRAAARVTQADIARALRAARQVEGAWAVEIDPSGTIRIVRSENPPAKQSPQSTGNRVAERPRTLL